jgi:hypothetical protein
MWLSVFAIMTKQRAGYEFNSRKRRALFNPASRPALVYTQQLIQTATQFSFLGVKRSERVAIRLPLPTAARSEKLELQLHSPLRKFHVVLTF